MAQARRKSRPKKPAPAGSGGYLAGVALLLAGMVIGSLATILWRGAQTAGVGVGVGIRHFVEGVHQPPAAGGEESAGGGETEPQRPSMRFGFFEVLPEIEVPLPSAAPPPAAQAVTATREQPGAQNAPPAERGAYMLQAASYRGRAEADRLKATLALEGIVAAIQKISIQGRGDFYRVRLGPYASYDEMVRAEQRLARIGIKALRLKVSGAG